MNGVEQPGHIPWNETWTSQQSLQPKKSCNCKEPRDWITKADWTIYIREHSDDNCRLPSVVSIFRVPEILKKSNKDAYVPSIVSLGPYHHRSAELPHMGNQKGKALGMMRTRFNNSNVTNVPDSKDFSDRAREEIMKLEVKIRDIYEDEIECDGETLALMLTLDGCFILEILRTLHWDELSIAKAERCYQPIFGIDKLCYARSDALKDILLLENQIPLIVLQKLLELESNSVDNIENMLFDMSMKLLSMLLPFWAHRDMTGKYSWQQVQVRDHLLGFLYGLIKCGLSDHGTVADQTNSNECNNAWRNPLKYAWRKLIKVLVKCCSADRAVENEDRIHCATELKKAGIKFKRWDEGTGKIKFDRNNATIYLPHIVIEDRTEIILRNLIAFEMCKPFPINYITCYVDFMDQLIDSKDDVIVLTKNDIITKCLGSDAEIAELFNGLCKDVTASKRDVFEEVRQEVNAHYRNEINVQIALLVEEHFQSPWKIVAWTVAIFLLGLATLQTIYTILPFYNNK